MGEGGGKFKPSNVILRGSNAPIEHGELRGEYGIKNIKRRKWQVRTWWRGRINRNKGTPTTLEATSPAGRRPEYLVASVCAPAARFLRAHIII
jgi:hypothetical protein